MYKIIKSDKDTYITNRVINGQRTYNSNVGIAGTLDLFKLYGASFDGNSPNTELSRALIHFDLSEIKEMLNSGKLDVTHPSFFAKLRLFDVYGGQPTPNKFTIVVSPLSKSFEEGYGKDVATYSDLDISNFLTASFNDEKWVGIGCTTSGSLSDICDYFTGSFEARQFFKTGEEDLDVDVTSAVSGVLSGLIPDNGFRISYSELEENNLRTYFVKRFSSRHAYNESKHPRLIIGFDDSLQDTTQGMKLDENVTSFFFNYDRGNPKNLKIPSGEVTGSNCVALHLKLPISGGVKQFIFTGSQHKNGNNPVTGIYSASFSLSSNDEDIKREISTSGSLKFIPVWTSIDSTKIFLTGSELLVSPPETSTRMLSAEKTFFVSTYGINDTHKSDESVVVKANIFDYNSTRLFAVKTPVGSPGNLQGAVTDAFYSVRDIATQEVIIPFDELKGSTRISSDEKTLYFTLDMSNLTTERSYTIDIMIKYGGKIQVHKDSSPVFRVVKS